MRKTERDNRNPSLFVFCWSEREKEESKWQRIKAKATSCILSSSFSLFTVFLFSSHRTTLPWRWWDLLDRPRQPSDDGRDEESGKNEQKKKKKKKKPTRWRTTSSLNCGWIELIFMLFCFFSWVFKTLLSSCWSWFEWVKTAEMNLWTSLCVPHKFTLFCTDRAD